MPGFVDVHSHVVPAGDDGATTIEEGLELCRLAYEAGTEILFATPHAHAPWDHYPRTVERDRLYAESLAEMRTRGRRAGGSTSGAAGRCSRARSQGTIPTTSCSTAPARS